MKTTSSGASRGTDIETIGWATSQKLRLLHNFSPAEFLAFDPYVTELKDDQLGVRLVSLETLLRGSGVCPGRLPLTKDTRHLIGEQQLKLMKRRYWSSTGPRRP